MPIKVLVLSTKPRYEFIFRTATFPFHE